jgi:hypothetical protein
MTFAKDTPPITIIDAATQGDKVVVIGKDGKVQILNDADVDVKLNDQVSDLVEKFLRRSMAAYEEMLHPTQYSPMTYVQPGDELGVLEKNVPAKSIKPEDAPEPIRQSLGEGTDPK